MIFGVILRNPLNLILKRLDYDSLNIICNMSTNLNKVCNNNVIGPLIEEKKEYIQGRKNREYYRKIHREMDLNKMKYGRSTSSNKNYTVSELKEYAKLLRLPVSGTKDDLLDRIWYDRSEMGI